MDLLTTFVSAYKSAPLSTNISHISVCSQWAAACNGVQPSKSVAFTSTLASNRILQR